MEEWRFLEVDWLTYADTAIYRPVLMRAVSEGIVPDTVSFCTFSKPSVITTFLNDPEKEINLDFCKINGIPVHRIVIGGGPIFGDTGYIITLLHIRKDNPKIPASPEKMLEKTLTRIAIGISKHFNIECRFRPINDLEVKCDDGAWRKIGPSGCNYEEKVVQMTSGIQVRKNNVNLITSIITAPPEKFQDKQAKSIQDRITYLVKIVGRSIDFNEIKQMFIENIEELYDVRLVTGELTKKEKDYYQEMKKEYTSEEFFMERSEKKFGAIPSDVVRKTIQFKIPGGPFIRVITMIRGVAIWDILITGTIHASPLKPTSPIHEIENILRGQPIDKKLFELKIGEILSRSNYSFTKVSPELLADKIFECAIR